MTLRQKMLAERALRQRERAPGFTRMHRKPRAHVGKWDPTGDWAPLNRPKLIPAWINGRTGKPHLHERATERAMRQWRA